MADLTLDDASAINKARALGGEVKMWLEDAELEQLVGVILTDLGHAELMASLKLTVPQTKDYFARPLSEFSDAKASNPKFEAVFLACADKVKDFRTYFKCLSEIHKRRRKYALILERQPFPTAQQIAPRAMLEYGILADKELASWMSWRKWLFDLDNRSGQETGYMFEPILAASLGGVSYSASASPVRRAKDGKKGRQVDCVVGKDAYEFKLRVTIAASGQGRFGEELEFPVDCKQSGFKPILVVLDPTDNPRLGQLIEAFHKSGGESFVGDKAWAHLEARSGPTMATFIERYVRTPLSKISPHIARPLDMSLTQKAGGHVEVSFIGAGGTVTRKIVRHEDQQLGGEEADEQASED